MHSTRTRVTTLGAVALAGGLLVAGPQAAASTAPPSNDAIIPPGDAPSDPTTAEFCDTEVEIEQATAGSEEDGPDPAVVGPLFETLVADAPADIAGVAGAIVELASAGNDETPEFNDAYGQLLDWMTTGCGFGELSFAAKEYSYGGLPGDIPAGRYVVNLENIGEQFHLAFLVRVNDGVDATTDELLAMPDDEVGELVTPLGQVFSDPGTTGRGVFDLSTPGRYLIVCPLPVGMTPEAMATGSIPDAAPHYTEGMYQELTVS